MKRIKLCQIYANMDRGKALRCMNVVYVWRSESGIIHNNFLDSGETISAEMDDKEISQI